ncbi:hypothetical protein GCM10010174_79800 [Kutzneria viridogrisea]|uniref:Membrane protein n=1 Tax=Kutzneria viridogrisea TaxID=47990 RepID=A0ABR6BBU0_9PSEU|nr:putative membrane protein [Kutzneria viridogrisea]
MRLPLVALLTAAAVLVPAPNASAAACTWRPTALPVPTDVSGSTVYATDGHGIYAGVAERGEYHFVLWKNGKLTDFGNLVGHTSSMHSVDGVNSAGTLVGSEGVRGHYPVPQALRSTGDKVELLPGKGISRAYAINEHGDIVGFGSVPDSSGQNRLLPVRWPADRPGTMEVLPGLPADWLNAAAVDMDADGTVLLSRNLGDDRPGFLWRNGVVTALPRPAGATSLSVQAIAGGRVVGSATISGTQHGVLWDRDGTITLLPRANGARDITSSGLIIGEDTAQRSAVWRLGTFDSELGADAELWTAGEDGTIAGRRNGQATYWRCG